MVPLSFGNKFRELEDRKVENHSKKLLGLFLSDKDYSK